MAATDEKSSWATAELNALAREVGSHDASISALNGGSLPAAYTIVPDGVGGATAYAGDAGLSTLTGADPADVFQNAINALAVQNGGTGGAIHFKKRHVWDKQVTLYPGISLIGDGPNGNKQTQMTGSQIASTVNGTTLLITGLNSSNRYFPFLSNFEMYGVDADTSQDLIVLDNSGGDVIYDCFLDHVTLFDAGRYGIYMPATATNVKLWLDGCYLESCQSDGVRILGGHFAMVNSYIFGQVGYGVYCDSTNSDVFIQNNRIWSNSTGGIFSPHTSQAIITGNSFDLNGSNTSATPQIMLKNTPFLVLNDNMFSDSRGASACLYHVRLAQGGGIGVGSVVGNTFGLGGQTQKIYKDYVLADKVIIADNPGYNDSYGKIASPFGTAHIGMEGAGAAAPTASTDYRVVGAPLFCVFSAGTGVSITIKDAAANTVTSGLTTYTGPLPVGYTINFGAFSVAPTVYVGVT